MRKEERYSSLFISYSHSMINIGYVLLICRRGDEYQVSNFQMKLDRHSFFMFKYEKKFFIDGKNRSIC